MTRRKLGSWHDRTVWTLLAVFLVMQALPHRLRRIASEPLQFVLLAPLRVVSSVNSRMATLKRDNDRLSQLAAQLAVENARLQARNVDTARLTGDSVPLVRAPIISRDIATLERYLVISRGKADGIRPGNPVITPDGVAGKITSASEHQALVETFYAVDAHIGVISLRSRAPGVTSPAGNGELAIHYLPKDADYQVGDTVVTAGLGEIYPKGLKVGMVVFADSQEEALFQPVRIRPFARIAPLEAVYVLCLPEHLPEPVTDSIAVPDTATESTDWNENVTPAEVKIPEEGGQ